MASQLYKILNNIEDGRQQIVKQLEAKDVQVEKTDSLQTLAGKIGSLSNDSWNKLTSLWTRPSDWPDTKDILANGEEREGLKPQAIFLLNNKQDITRLRSKNTASNGTIDSIGATAYLMSDGTYYSNVTSTIDHEWDKSKDINGKYRYILCYFGETVAAAYIPQGAHIIEAILGAFSYTTATLINSNDFSQYEDLENFEILDTSKITNISVFGSGQRVFSYLKDIKRIYLGSVTSMYGKSGYEFLRNMPQLQIFEAPNLTTALSQTGFGQANIKVLKTPKCGINTYATAGGFTGLEELDCPSLTITSYVSHMPINNANVKFSGNFAAPNNLTEVNWIYLNNSSGATAYRFNNCPLLTKVDLSSAEQIGITGKYYLSIGVGSPNLKTIIWPAVGGNVDISTLELDSDSIADLVNKMIRNTNTTPLYIAMSEKNKNELTETQLATIAEKGWEIR